MLLLLQQHLVAIFVAIEMEMEKLMKSIFKLLGNGQLIDVCRRKVVCRALCGYKASLQLCCFSARCLLLVGWLAVYCLLHMTYNNIAYFT